MFEVLHTGFRFPREYAGLKTAQLVYDKEVQWTLGAMLFKTRFLPLRYASSTTLTHTHTPIFSIYTLLKFKANSFGLANV